jgi:hypothetical protein
MRLSRTPTSPFSPFRFRGGSAIYLDAAHLPKDVRRDLEGLAFTLLASRRLALLLWVGWALLLSALLVTSTVLLAAQASSGVIIGVFWLWTGGAVAGLALGSQLWTNAARPFLFMRACRRLGLSDALAQGIFCQQEMAWARHLQKIRLQAEASS